MEEWYYAAADGRNVGPVTAATLRSELGRRTIQWSTQVWRQGMGAWQPLSEVAAQLGLAAPAAPPAIPGGGLDLQGTAHPANAAPVAVAPSGLETGGVSFYAVAEPLPVAPATAPAPTVDKLGRPLRDPAAALDPGPVVQAGLLRRMAAWIVDSALLSLVAGLIMLIWTIWVGRRAMANAQMLDPEGAALAIRNFLTMPLVAVLAARAHYFAWFHSRRGATPGKLLTGIRVVDKHGHDLEYTHALGRWLASGLNWITCGVGALIGVFPPRKAMLHDVVAGTQVVDQWAYTNSPEWQSERPGAVALGIVGVTLLGGFLLVNQSLGAYRKYLIRVGAAQGRATAEPLQYAIDGYLRTNQRCPANGDDPFRQPGDYADGPVTEIRFEEGADAGACRIVVRLRQGMHSGDVPELRMERSPATGSWNCSSNLPAALAIPGCAAP